MADATATGPRLVLVLFKRVEQVKGANVIACIDGNRIEDRARPLLRCRVTMSAVENSEIIYVKNMILYLCMHESLDEDD